MHVGFKITLEDGSTISSHDEMWNQVRDHAHALYPNSDKKWARYDLVTDEGHSYGVDFITGRFHIDGVFFNSADQKTETFLTSRKEEQHFDSSKAWSILDGMYYFPVVGRRVYKGENIDQTLYFCGWKIKFDNRTIQKLLLFNPSTSAIVLT